MWCSACQQDVPVVSPQAREARCPRCKQPFETKHRPVTPASATQLDMGLDLDAKAAPTTPPIQFDDWELTERLKRIERLLSRQISTKKDADCRNGEATFANDRSFNSGAPQGRRLADTNGFQLESAGDSSAIPRRIRERAESGSSLLFATTLVLIGAAIWLIGSSPVAEWTMPVGQAAALDRVPFHETGAIIVVMGACVAMWRVASMIRRVDSRLDSLDTTTSDLRYSLAHRNANSGGAAFYADLARGASPAMLLADLKGQVDRLAVRMIADG